MNLHPVSVYLPDGQYVKSSTSRLKVDGECPTAIVKAYVYVEVQISAQTCQLNVNNEQITYL